MKTKLTLIGAILMASFFAFGVSHVALGQQGSYGQKTNTSTSSTGGSAAAKDSGEAKPGTVLAGGVIVATPITQEEAMKKYPPPSSGKYPSGDRPYSHTPGHILSPYPPHKEFDCSKIGHGELVLDTWTKKVFVRP
jgi:hypothetical protein